MPAFGVRSVFGQAPSGIVMPDPIGQWLYTEGSGNTIADSSGNGYDANLNAGTWVPGYNGTGGISFGDSNNQYARTISTVVHNVGMGDFSWCLRAMVNQPGVNDTCYGCANDAYAPSFITRRGGAFPYACAMWIGGWRQFDTLLTVDQYYMLILQRESGVAKLYIDNVKEATEHAFTDSLANGPFSMANQGTSYSGRVELSNVHFFTQALDATQRQFIVDNY